MPLQFGFGLVELAPLKAVPTGFAPATSAVTRQCSCSLSYETVICVKPRRGVEPRPAPYQGTALPLELPRLQNTTGWTRTTNLSVIGGVLCPMSYGRTMVAFTCQRTATENGPRWGSNPRRAAFQTAALPAELPGQDFILRHERAAQPPAFPAANKSQSRARKKPAVFKGRGPGIKRRNVRSHSHDHGPRPQTRIVKPASSDRSAPSGDARSEPALAFVSQVHP